MDESSELLKKEKSSFFQNTGNQFVEVSSEDYNCVYRKKRVSNTLLSNLVEGTPLDFKYAYDTMAQDEDSDSFRIGRWFHLAVLEPDVFEKTVQIRQPRQRVDDKASHLLETEFRQICYMRDAIYRDPSIGGMFKKLSKGFEKTVFFNCPYTGLAAMTKLDITQGDEKESWVLDLKSASDVSEEGFRHSIHKYNYDLQAYMYKLSFDLVTGVESKGFGWLVVEKKPPYKVRLYTAAPLVLQSGEVKFRRAMKILSWCLKRGQFPDIGGRAIELEQRHYDYEKACRDEVAAVDSGKSLEEYIEEKLEHGELR